MPLTIDVVSSVPIIGTISKPAAVALTPAAICRYVGRYPSTPNIDTPVKSPAMVVRLKLRSLNRCRGMIGSLACDSFHTNSAPVTAAPANRPMIINEDHSYCDPPQVEAKTRHVVAMETSTMPI